MTFEERMQDIKMHPERHQHTWDELLACCSSSENALDTAILDAHRGILGRPKCDVISGPCGCGAWHKPEADKP